MAAKRSADNHAAFFLSSECGWQARTIAQRAEFNPASLISGGASPKFNLIGGETSGVTEK
jgi:hypothetical protein